MVLAIEPMINQGTHRIRQLKDGWTILTADGQPSAHFEHNVALVDGKPELLSTFQYIYDALGLESDEETPFRAQPLTLWNGCWIFFPRPWLIQLSLFFRPFIKLYFKGNRFEDPIDGSCYRTFLPMVIKFLEKMPFVLELYRWNVTGCCGCI